jgi:Rod binding domain-containing protein
MASAAAFTATSPGLNPADLMAAKSPKPKSMTETKARAAAQDFEAVFLNSMFQHMFTGLQGDGPLGGKGATGVWRSFLTDQYARNIAKAGGIGIADQVYRSLLAQQEARS